MGFDKTDKIRELGDVDVEKAASRVPEALGSDPFGAGRTDVGVNARTREQLNRTLPQANVARQSKRDGACTSERCHRGERRDPEHTDPG